jgi:hypothetical protein
MDASRRLGRRTFVTDLGRGAVALAVLGIAGCAPSASGTARPSSLAPSAVPEGTDPTPAASPAGGASASSPPDALAWSRANLGFVSAYLLVRGG